MPTELEELVEFLHHGNTQVRQIACESLVGYSISDPKLFKAHQLLPVKDLKLLVRDYEPISKNALIILINLSSHDTEILTSVATDGPFLTDTLLSKITNPKEPHADEIGMLLANLAKSDPFLDSITSLTLSGPSKTSTSLRALDQLMDLFVTGATGTLNPRANFDYLAYFFADVSKTQPGRTYFVSRQPYDDVVPITKLTVFTEHRSLVRRKGVASTIKNVAFEIPAHPMLLSSADANLLPYILLPLAGNEEFDDDESAAMLPDLQLLPPDKERDGDHEIVITHLETLLLLTTTRPGRDLMREVKVYPIIRECHLHIDDEDVRQACDRLVQVLLRDEEEEREGKGEDGHMIREIQEDDDEKIEEIF